MMNSNALKALTKIYDLLDSDFLYLSRIRTNKRLIKEYVNEIYQAGYNQSCKDIIRDLKEVNYAQEK